MSNQIPTKRDVKFLLSEDIRQEVHGKLSLQGYMPGEHFLVGGKPPDGAGSNVAFVLPSLAFLFVITGGEGKFSGRFKVIAPDKKTTLVDTPAEKPIDKPRGKTAVFAMTSRPFVGPSFGAYTVQLELDKAKFVFPMRIEKSPKAAP